MTDFAIKMWNVKKYPKYVIGSYYGFKHLTFQTPNIRERHVYDIGIHIGKTFYLLMGILRFKQKPNTSSLKSFDSGGSTHFAKDLKYNGSGVRKP